MKKSIIDIAKECLEIEVQALHLLTNHLEKSFVDCIEMIITHDCRVVLSGIGKSALVAQKIAATMNSTGTKATFLHASDALHGDMGLINTSDVLCLLSKSGETEELKVLVPLVQNMGCKVIAITANNESYLAIHADYVLYTPIEREADPNNLAPTASTIAQMAMGDAMAMCLAYERGFTNEDFAKFHPSGSLGKQLYLRVKDVYRLHGKPVNGLSDSIQSVILCMSKNRLGATVIESSDNKVLGIITDGDLRRMMEMHQTFTHLRASDIMNKNPKMIDASALAVEALDTMRKNNISQLVVTENNSYVGMIHLHDLIKEGLI